MKVPPAAFLHTTLPLGIDRIDRLDTGRYHSIWLPDHEAEDELLRLVGSSAEHVGSDIEKRV